MKNKIFLHSIVLKKNNIFIFLLVLAGFLVLVRLAGEAWLAQPAGAPSKDVLTRATGSVGTTGELFWEGVQEETIKEFGQRQGTWDEPGKTAQGTAEKKAPPADTGRSAKGDFFMEYRLERDRNRSQQIDVMREIVNNPNSIDDSRREAQKRLLHISQVMEKEMELENLIRARGFKDAVVFVEDGALTVIVQAGELKESDIGKINQLATHVTGARKEEIVIIPKS